MPRTRNWFPLIPLALLAACQHLAPPLGVGKPDLVLEESGNMGRYLIPGDPPASSAKPTAKTYFYLEQNLKIRATDAGTQRLELAPEERQNIEQILARSRNGEPIN